jgi:hypothetical protein
MHPAILQVQDEIVFYLQRMQQAVAKGISSTANSHKKLPSNFTRACIEDNGQDKPGKNLIHVLGLHFNVMPPLFLHQTIVPFSAELFLIVTTYKLQVVLAQSKRAVL